jgi:hypothetical protein
MAKDPGSWQALCVESLDLLLKYGNPEIRLHFLVDSSGHGTEIQPDPAWT